MRRTRPSTYAVGLALTAFLVVAGCSDPAPTSTATSSSTSNGTPTTSTPTTSSAAPTTPETSASTTTAGDPNIPPAARAQTIEGAQEFSKYFYKLIARSWSQPDPTAIDPYVLPSCKACSAYRSTATDTKNKGWRYVGEPVTVISAVTARLIDGNAEVSVTGEQMQATVVDASGKTIQEVPRNPHVDSVLYLSYSNGWKVSEIKAVQR